MKQRNILQKQQAEDAKQTVRAETPADAEFKLRVNLHRSQDRDATYAEIEARAVADVQATIDPGYEPRRAGA
jgi:hypothetical protein